MRLLVRPERFELPTCCSGGNRSIQLSYGRAVTTVYMGGRTGGNAGALLAFFGSVSRLTSGRAGAPNCGRRDPGHHRLRHCAQFWDEPHSR